MTTAIICRCSFCSNEIEFEARRDGETVPCPHCAMETELYIPGSETLVVSGTSSITPPQLPPPIIKRATTENGETIFYAEPGILVTNARFVIGGQTFSMSNLTSVRGLEIPPNNAGLALLSIFAGFVVLIGAALLADDWKRGAGWLTVLFGIFVIIAAHYGGKAKKPTFQVWVNTAGGEQKVLQSQDALTIALIIEGINEAIAFRG